VGADAPDPRAHAASFLHFPAVDEGNGREGDGVCDARQWRRLLGVDGRRVVVEGVELDEGAGAVVVHVRPFADRRRIGTDGTGQAPWRAAVRPGTV
jgi:hypothetical protein